VAGTSAGRRVSSFGDIERDAGAVRIELVRGDITEQTADAIVTAANESLLGGGGVDGAIHAAAGPQLAEAGARLAPCDPGDAKVTDAFGLRPRFRWVIHTVGPVWDGGAYGERETLSSCYRRVLEVADQIGAATVAIPAIATGVYGYPFDEAAHIAVHTLRTTPTKVSVVCLVAFDGENHSALAARLASD
jgi:O-acetyl-ADP-ribose deacetylase (regulator of RNase III)